MAVVPQRGAELLNPPRRVMEVMNRVALRNLSEISIRGSARYVV